MSSDTELFQQTLKELLEATEEYLSADPNMPRYQGSRNVLEAKVEAARLVVDAFREVFGG